VYKTSYRQGVLTVLTWLVFNTNSLAKKHEFIGDLTALILICRLRNVWSKSATVTQTSNYFHCRQFSTLLFTFIHHLIIKYYLTHYLVLPKV